MPEVTRTPVRRIAAFLRWVSGRISGARRRGSGPALDEAAGRAAEDAVQFEERPPGREGSEEAPSRQQPVERAPHLAMPVVEIAEHDHAFGRIRGARQSHQLADLTLALAHAQAEMGG